MALRTTMQRARYPDREARSEAEGMAMETFHKDFDEHAARLTALLVDGEPWFKGREAAAALGYKHASKAILDHVDDDEKESLRNLRGPAMGTLTNGNEGASWYISESGLYSLIMSSRLPCAKAFKKWVLREVLPTLRRTGSYHVQPTLREEEEEPPPVEAPPAVPVTEAQQWENRRARLAAMASARSLAIEAEVPLSSAHTSAIRAAINEVLLPPDREQKDMIDAAEFLFRKGHGEEEIRRLAPEFGKALKVAWEYMQGERVVTNLHEFGTGASEVRMYHARDDALFLDGVYAKFQERGLYERVCHNRKRAQDRMLSDVQEALQDARGFRNKRARLALD